MNNLFRIESNRINKNYEFRRRKTSDKRTFSNFITLKVIVIKKRK